MSLGLQGLLWCLCFVVLEGAQAVYFGGLFQRMDSFLIGSLVFGVTAVGAVGWTLARRPAQVRVALANPGMLLILNLCAAW